MKRFILLIIFVIPLSLFAEGSRGVAGATFLELPYGSRSIGMGEAFTAMIEDPNVAYYNPAGLATLKYPELSVFHSELIEDSRLENISGVFKYKKGFINISSTMFWVVPFERIDINGNSRGKVNFYNFSESVGYGYDFGVFAAGCNLKYIYERVDDKNISSVGVDLGLLKGFYIYTPFAAPPRNFFIGFTLQNFGAPVNKSPLPRKTRLGLMYMPVDFIKITTDFSQNAIYSSDLYDFTYGFNESFQINTGLELTYLDILYFRTGWRFNDSGKYSFGVGLNYAIENVSFILDTAISDNGVFGPVYSINFIAKLIPKVVTVEDINKANEYYKKGIKSYVSDDLDSAIEFFKQTKEYNPYHKNIDDKIKDLEKLKELKEKNEQREKGFEEY